MIETAYKKTIIKDKINVVYPNTLKAHINKKEINKLNIPTLFNTAIIGTFLPQQPHLLNRCVHFSTTNEALQIQLVLPINNPTRIKIEVSNIDYNPPTYINKGAERADLWFCLNDSNIPIASYYKNLNYLIFHIFEYNIDTGEFSNRQGIEIINAVFNNIIATGYKLHPNNTKLLIGADPEFSIIDKQGQRISAATVLKNPSTSMSAQIGVDGAKHTGELRPTAMDDPIFLVKKQIKMLLYQLKKDLPTGLGVTSGGGFSDPLGGHIHFNTLISSEEVQLLDDFVGIPTTILKGGRRAGGSYGSAGDVRIQPHGIEYRTPPSTLLPEALEAQWVTAFSIIRRWRRAAPGTKFSYRINKKKIPTLQNYLQFAPTKRYTEHVIKFYKFITEGSYNTTENILDLWFSPTNKRTKGTHHPRVILEDKPPWFKGRSKYAVTNLTEEKKIKIKSYGPTFIKDKTDIPNDAVILELGLNEYATVVGKEEKFNNICSKIATTLGANVVVMRADMVRLRHPHTWRDKKRNKVTPTLIQFLAREIYFNTNTTYTQE